MATLSAGNFSKNLLTGGVGFCRIERMFESVGHEPAPSNFTAAGTPATVVESTARRLAQGAAELTDDQLVDRSRELASTLSAAEAELASVLAEVEIRRLHSQWECRSVEFFATWHCQLGPRRARSIAALGRALHEFPVLAEAVTEGRLSVSKAEPIIRVATPETEAALVDLAVHATVGQVQRICSTWRRVEATELAEASSPESTSIGRVIIIRDEDGIELRARFDHVHGELVLASLETAIAAVRAEREHAAALDGPAPMKLDRSQWRAEGLLRLCETAPNSSPPTLQPSGFTAQLVVHVPVDTLIDPADISGTYTSDSDGAANAGDVLEPAGVAIRRDAARWLACDAGLLTVLEDGNGDPLHLGRRAITIRHNNAEPFTPAIAPVPGRGVQQQWFRSTIAIIGPSAVTTMSRISSLNVAITTALCIVATSASRPTRMAPFTTGAPMVRRFSPILRPSIHPESPHSRPPAICENDNDTTESTSMIEGACPNGLATPCA